MKASLAQGFYQSGCDHCAYVVEDIAPVQHPDQLRNTVASRRSGAVGFTGVVTVRAYTKSSSEAVRHSFNVTLNK